MDNLNIRGKNMPRRKKKVIFNHNSIKQTELGHKYNNKIIAINNIIQNTFNKSLDIISETETETENKYNIIKDIILDKLEELGNSINSWDLLKKSKYSFKTDIKNERMEFVLSLFIKSNEDPLLFKKNIYDSILTKNFEIEFLNEVLFIILDELYTLLENNI